jgi:hypothetical protein
MPLIILSLGLLAAMPGRFPRVRTQTAASVGGSVVDPVLANASSMYFGGDNSIVDIDEPADLEQTPGTTSFTYAKWFKRGETGDFERHLGGKARLGAGGQVGVVAAVRADNQIATLVYGGENTFGGDIGGSVFGWHLWALSVAGPTGKLYLDGRQVGSTFAVGAGWNTDADWLIGGTRYDTNSDVGYPFEGWIDEVSYWGDDFTDAEHLELFNSGDPMNLAAHSKAAFLLHWYRMGDGDTYPTILDQVGVADGTATMGLGAGSIQSVVPVGLDPLPCVAASGCYVHLVIDDWDGSGATWTDRMAHTDGTKQGSPTRALTPNFMGRYAATVPTGACFTIANDEITSTSTTRTYEILVDNWPAGAPGGMYLAARTNGTNSQLYNLLFRSNATVVESAVYNAAIAVYLGSAGSAYTNTDSKAVAWTITMDMSAPRYTLYRNGTQVFQDTTASGTLTTAVTNQSLGLGCRWNQSAVQGGPQSFMGGRILEFLRHDVELSAATVASRLTQFNALKGY